MLANTPLKKTEITNSAETQSADDKSPILETLLQLRKTKDFVQYYNSESKNPFYIAYFQSLIDSSILHNDILANILKSEVSNVDDFIKIIPIEDIKIVETKEEIEEQLIIGSVIIYFHVDDNRVACIPAQSVHGRNVSSPEIEFSVIGPQDAFVEGIDININLIRKRIPSSKLTFKEITIGKLSKTKVVVAYIDGIANDQNVDTVLQRLRDIEFDQILDISYIEQLLQDNTNSPFPQLISTERPDRVAAILAEGKIAIIADGSNHVITGPTTFVEFFTSMEDYYMSWLVGSAFRIIRFMAVAFSIFATPIYVAVLSYHYELIPRDLLATLTSSRANIPFPPVIEAIFLELTIELLREAGARLPTKVGQTIGIVGGIVIGQASVEAGLTSNILLIIVALAALASFTTPVYQMGSTIRLLRFPFIIFAFLWGGLGIVLCLTFLIVHLLRLSSLGNPYLAPLYPLRIADWKDAFIRLPFSMFSIRPFITRSKDIMRFKESNAKEKKDNKK
ncbi:spore germination protein [Lottiidibacillus patelloidae]|uniref:Spore germination protein n=1 Tax=Lottiidibacillus patelloidae TaxID=2670334 RepID=A0A263BWC6_9BACI|nr:spore germination protein [Lottiidibacillus patelloidae]